LRGEKKRHPFDGMPLPLVPLIPLMGCTSALPISLNQ